jgi:hypothetical protein
MHALKSNRGSVLIVALMFAAIIAISLTSYLKLSLSAGTLANRGFYMNAAQNLVDAGFERTIWALNDARIHSSPLNSNWTTYGGFTEITPSTEYRGTFPSSTDYYPLSAGAKGQVKVWALYDTTTKVWHAVAKATITLGDGTTLDKLAECYLQQRSWSDGGMVTRHGMTFNGDVRVDSWVSRPTPSDDIRYTTSIAGIARSNAQISTPAIVTVQNADIYGYVAIGADTVTSTNPDVGATGRIGDFGVGNGYKDLNRITCDFSASFPDADLPASLPGTTAAITASRVLATGTYVVPSITVAGSGAGADTIEIGGPSTPATGTLVVIGNITMDGGSQIIVYPGSKLTLYVGGDISMGGTSQIQNGNSIPNNPDCLTILGTRTEAAIAGGSLMQNWTLRGGSYLSCVIYAPNADVSVNGNTNTYGSLVGNTVAIVGTGDFHQDESLRNNRVSGLWGLMKWRELATATERTTYATQLAF